MIYYYFFGKPSPSGWWKKLKEVFQFVFFMVLAIKLITWTNPAQHTSAKTWYPWAQEELANVLGVQMILLEDMRASLSSSPAQVEEGGLGFQDLKKIWISVWLAKIFGEASSQRPFLQFVQKQKRKTCRRVDNVNNTAAHLLVAAMDVTAYTMIWMKMAIPWFEWKWPRLHSPKKKKKNPKFLEYIEQKDDSSECTVGN